jgi:hypothetical protein
MANMLTFNSLLQDTGLDLKQVYLVRHQDRRMPKGRTIFRAWLTERENFELYQTIQNWKYRFPVGSTVASFIVTPDGDTMFVGLYEVTSVSQATTAFDDPLLGTQPPGNRAYHEMKRSDRLRNLEAKLIVDWGKARQFRQRAHKQNKIVLEIRREPPPGDKTASS